mgnify:CR=1 FL=1|jgi:hypothetical protein
MKNTHSFEDAEFFTNSLYEAVELDVELAVENMSPEECVVFTREFLQLMQDWQPQAIDLKAHPLEGAAHGLYLSMLFGHCFKQAYHFSNRYLIAKESIENALQED